MPRTSLNSKRAMLICCLAAVTSSVLSTGAWGQTTAADAHEKEAGLQQITVTATRRETQLSETPIALSVLTLDQLNNQHIGTLSDVELGVPNLVFTQVTRQETVFSIRGTGVDNDTPGADAGVSVFIDGVPRTGVHDTTPDLFDLQSVEVLRGPQGTLFGRNTTGGAVIMRTIAPSFDPSFKGQLTYGNFNLAEVNGLATGPLVSNVLAGKHIRDQRSGGKAIDLSQVEVAVSELAFEGRVEARRDRAHDHGAARGVPAEQRALRSPQHLDALKIE